METTLHPFRLGMRHGISIALGYLSVSISFGVLAVQSGLSIWEAFAISATNLTSAGQVAGIGLIAVNAPYFELCLTELVINIRYALMSLALSQKAGSSFHTPQRMLAAFGVTDEIFAVASVQEGFLTPSYLYGMILVAFLGWTGGTVIGAAAGSLLPEMIANALSISLYGMFLAIFIPPMRKSRGIAIVVAIAAGCSVLFSLLDQWLSGGFAMILAAILAALTGAWFFPVSNTTNAEVKK